LWTSFGTRAAGSNIYTWQTPVRVEGTTVINPPLKNATGYLYYSVASENAPSTPQAVPNSYVFTTGLFGTANATGSTGVTTNWKTTFSAAPASTTLKMWAVRYSVQETVSGGAQVIDISDPPFTHQNFNGLVTFTNQTYSTPAQVDGKITTATGLEAGETVASKISSATGLTAGETVTSKINTATSGLASTAYVSTTAFANAVSTNMTSIDGGKIDTGFISAQRLQIGKTNPDGTGNYIRMFDNKIVVYSSNNPRVVIGNLL
jgi:hypothetical protein